MVKHTRLSRQRLLEKWKRIENQMSGNPTTQELTRRRDAELCETLFEQNWMWDSQREIPNCRTGDRGGASRAAQPTRVPGTISLSGSSA